MASVLSSSDSNGEAEVDLVAHPHNLAGDGTEDMGGVTPRPSKRRRAALSDVSNTTPLPVRLSIPASGPGSPAVRLQRFSLLSRAATCVVAPIKPAEENLLAPPRLRGTLECDVVCCCRCSWAQPLRPRVRRLCARDTEEHAEYQLLHGMNKRFVADCHTGGSLLTGRACVHEAEVHFIVDGGVSKEPDVLGYTAVMRNYEHSVKPNVPDIDKKTQARAQNLPKRLPLLAQLFVEPDRRRQGVATEGLRLLLAGQRAFVVDAPARATLIVLERIGFVLVGVRSGSEGQPLCLFVRAAQQIDENGP